MVPLPVTTDAVSVFDSSNHTSLLLWNKRRTLHPNLWILRLKAWFLCGSSPEKHHALK
ncbi:hypothetical protein KIL84_017595, partial [Mauremys mutica]